METIDIFLFFIVTPILIALVITMILIVKKATKIESTTIQHEHKEDTRFDYKKQAFESIDNRFDSISNIISTDIVTPLQNVNNRISSMGIEATMDNLLKSLNDWEIDFNRIGEKTVCIPSTIDDLKITYLVTLDIERQLLHFQSFCFAFEKFDDKIFKFLNDINVSTVVGHIQIQELSSKFLPIYSYALLLQDNKLSRTTFIESLKYIGFTMQNIFKNQQKELNISITIILFNDYLKLALGEEKYKELEDKLPK